MNKKEMKKKKRNTERVIKLYFCIYRQLRPVYVRQAIFYINTSIVNDLCVLLLSDILVLLTINSKKNSLAILHYDERLANTKLNELVNGT